jgi:hypothetical protein
MSDESAVNAVCDFSERKFESTRFVSTNVSTLNNQKRVSSRRKKLLIVACAGSIFFSAHAFAFETNGDLDLGFDPGKITNGQVQAAVVQPDKKLVIAGGR